MSLEQSLALTPPSAIVAHYAQRPRTPGKEHLLLDIGCGPLARNSLYMARQGFSVEAIDSDPMAISEAEERAQRLGITGCRFTVLDAQKLDTLDGDFTGVMANEVLQDFSKGEAYDLLRTAQERTRRGGVHLVSAYMVDASVGKKPHLFHQGELARFYESTGWAVMYQRDSQRAPQEHDGELLPRSLSSIYARRR